MFKKEMSISFHVGSKKNAIPNLKKLKAIFIHNLRKYEKSNNPDLDLNLSKYNIILKGTNNLVQDKKKPIADFKKIFCNRLSFSVKFNC